MSVDKAKAAGETTPAVPAMPRAVRGSIPPLFRKLDWLTFAVIVGSVFIGYFLTLAPDVTLQDSGELATGSFYAGVPHPPGYPLWTIITWAFTKLIPFGNVAYRVAIASAVASALAAGLLGLMVSRGSSMLIESIEAFKGISRSAENAICVVAGFVAGLLLAFNGYMWSQSVIVEVYPLSVLSFMCVFCCLLRWIYVPNQRRYLYWAWFLFGVCFTNHQTLILAAMGLEVVVIVTQPKMGRDLLLVNSILFGVGLVAIFSGLLGTFAPSEMVTIIFCIVGVCSILGCGWLVFVTKGIGTETLSVLIMFSLWLAGAAIFFYMPLTSMTNPPMNWGYARTVNGFIHALTRGQYEKTNPTNFFKDPERLFNQLRMYFEGASEEFNLINLLLALVPIIFFFRIQRRERAWLISLASIWVCMSFLLMILLNPNPDRASRDLIKVFFTASYTAIAMFAGYGITLSAAAMLTCYQRFRFWGLCGGILGFALALFSLFKTVIGIYPGTGQSGAEVVIHAIKMAFNPNHYGLPIFACLLLVVLATVFVLVLLVSPTKPRIFVALGLFALLPFHSIMSHWSDNEQRDHWFGYWFGHDMFTPPFGIYPEMTRNAVLFGGTDPGRFCPTYMIFCESFIPLEKRPKEDPKFDRRDVYLITQNALADLTYLDYIRAQYYRSAQSDPAFFQEMLRSANEKSLDVKTNLLARIAGQVLDKPFTKLGANVEARRRADRVYPPNEIYTPSADEGEHSRADYYNDAARRIEHDTRFPNEPRQVKPGEGVQLAEGGRIIVTSGQVSVMAINGLLTKIIFDRNPTNEFYVEESMALEWMNPYLTPFGIIMKINRQPLERFSDDIIKNDHQFWSLYSKRLVGDWVNYDTKTSDLAEFAEKVFHQRDYNGFIGDRKFIRDDDAQKSFSKLRGSIAELYEWRFRQSKDPVESRRMLREAEFAYKQALAFCPYSAEAVYRYVELLMNTGRLEDALIVAQTCYRLDPENEQIARMVDNILKIQSRAGPAAQRDASQSNASQIQAAVEVWEKEYREHPTNFQTAFDLASAYLQLQQTNRAEQVLSQVAAHPQANPNVIAFAAKFFDQLSDLPKLEATLQRLTQLDAHSPEAWYDLAAAETLLGKTNQALDDLRRSAEENTSRLARDPKATNLLRSLPVNPRFKALQNLPEFQQLVPK